MEKIRKEDIRKALAFVVLFHIGLIVIFIFSRLTWSNPPFQQETVATIDFTESGGAGSSGGGEKVSDVQEEAARDAEETETSQEEQETYTEEESETEVQETATEGGESDSDGESNQGDAVNPLYQFGGSGGGSDGGDGGGEGNAPGEGGDGPGGFGTGIGTLTRSVLSKPEVKNPMQQTGNVLVEIYVNREGKVEKAKALLNDIKTTTSHQAHIKAAEKAAKQFKFKPNKNAAKLEIGTVIVEFTLD